MSLSKTFSVFLNETDPAIVKARCLNWKWVNPEFLDFLIDCYSQKIKELTSITFKEETDPNGYDTDEDYHGA